MGEERVWIYVGMLPPTPHTHSHAHKQARTTPSRHCGRSRCMLTGNIVLSSIYRAAIECSIGDLRCVEKTRSCGEVLNRTSLSLSLPWQTSSRWPACRVPPRFGQTTQWLSATFVYKGTVIVNGNKIYYLYLKSFQINTFKLDSFGVFGTEAGLWYVPVIQWSCKTLQLPVISIWKHQHSVGLWFHQVFWFVAMVMT